MRECGIWYWPKAGNFKLAVIRIKDQNEPVIIKYSLIKWGERIIQLKEELEIPLKKANNPFSLKSEEANILLDNYIRQNMEMLAEEGEEK